MNEKREGIPRIGALMYVRIRDTKQVRTEEISHAELIVDYDENDEIVGVEILGRLLRLSVEQHYD